jgi:NitT/TauT family transport system ATP-binding protein
MDTTLYEDIDIINMFNINQTYTTKKEEVRIFDNLNFNIKDIKNECQFVTILGKSGCGKSTLLRYISGLQKPTSGEIKIYGKTKTEKDRIPMIFQQFSSFPWKKVIDNIALPLILKNVNKTEAYDKAEAMIKVVGLTGNENKWAKYPLLSGGQLQRVAIARSLISNSQILLLDEPFSALDIRNRTELQNILLNIFYNKNGIDVTFILVTHDIREAVYLSNRIYIMQTNPGRIYKEYIINLGERKPEIKNTPDFLNIVSQIEKDFETI